MANRWVFRLFMRGGGRLLLVIKLAMTKMPLLWDSHEVVAECVLISSVSRPLCEGVIWAQIAAIRDDFSAPSVQQQLADLVEEARRYVSRESGCGLAIREAA